ncbi:MAG TPA: acyltransferase [Mucilaginibacter sp.]|jgi:maltose O-acetyltransferase
MRENIIQVKTVGPDGRIHIEGDWYHNGIPSNVTLAESVYMDTSYGLSAFYAESKDALTIDEASGCYGVVNFIVSKEGKVSVGKFSVLNETTIVCNQMVIIGNHCMLAWGSVVTDTWLDATSYSLELRKQLLINVSQNPLRPHPFPGTSLPVVIEDNCWVGFNAIIMPGVRLGRGCVVGCKTVVETDVPPYAVVTGSPARIVKYLAADDTDDKREEALIHYLM